MLSSRFLSWSSSSFLFWCSSFRLITCLVVSSCEYACKVFKRIQCTRETTGSRIIPNIWSELQSLGPQANQNQLSQRKSPLKESLFEATIYSIVILCSWASTSPGVSIQVQQVVLAIAQIPPYSAQIWSRAILSSRTTLARESKEFLWGRYCFSSRFSNIFKS